MGMYCQLRAVTPDDIRQGLQPLVDLLDRPSSPTVSLEKAWHGLHYLLTGTAWEGEAPLNFIVLGGEPIGEDDFGMGPARLLAPEQVQELDAALWPVTDEQLWGRFDKDRLHAEEIYPGIWDEPEADLREEYLMYFHELKTFVRQAAGNGCGLVIVLS